MEEYVKNLRDDSFDEELKNNELVVVQFWAPWCGPCMMLKPVVEEVAKEYSDKMSFTKMNVDDNQEIPMKYSIRSIPSLVFFKNGELVDKSVGSLSKKALIDKIDKIIS